MSKGVKLVIVAFLYFKSLKLIPSDHLDSGSNGSNLNLFSTIISTLGSFNNIRMISVYPFSEAIRIAVLLSTEGSTRLSFNNN